MSNLPIHPQAINAITSDDPESYRYNPPVTNDTYAAAFADPGPLRHQGASPPTTGLTPPPTHTRQPALGVGGCIDVGEEGGGRCCT